MSFPIDLSVYQPVPLDPSQPGLTEDQRDQLQTNIQLARDVIVFFTAVADAKGLGGHTGGPYDIVPEVLLADGFMKGPASVVPIYFDEAGHRVAIQYLMSVLNGEMEAERLLHYREADSKLPGHPEKDFTPGVKFSSGRLGHMWPFCNGVALANPEAAVVLFGSDGSQQEGNDAEAARLAVAQNLNIKLLIDDNDVTIAGHPSNYLPGYDVTRTLQGHGLQVSVGDGENLNQLYQRFAHALLHDGPVGLVNKRRMAPGIEGLEGSIHGHDVIKVELALKYLEQRGHTEAIAYLKNATKSKGPGQLRGSTEKHGKNRNVFGEIVAEILQEMDPVKRKASVMCIDSDLEGSCGLNNIRKACPEIFISSGIMERGNYSAAAGFGFEEGKQGIFGTFSAFLEMCVSEITMARLNQANVLAHFSHAGVDDMADNTCHFGLNNMFADNGLPEHDTTRLYFPADAHQMRAVVRGVFDDPGQRFVFSTRSSVPYILDEKGTEMFGGDYTFTPDQDEVIREGSAGYIVSFGDILYRALDAVERLRSEGIDVGLINKPTLNTIDEATLEKVGSTPFVLIAESFNVKTGLGSRYGTWLLERGLAPRYAHLGTHREGNGGLWEHVVWQGIDAEAIYQKAKSMC